MLIVSTSDSHMGLAGIRVFTENPNITGIDEVAGPATDPHADWMMFQTVFNDTGEQSTQVDVKSMRKLDEVSLSLVLSLQQVDEVAAQWRYQASVLVALP